MSNHRLSSPDTLPRSTTGTAAAEPSRATVMDWALLLGLVICGGSSFAGIRIAVETAPPTLIAFGRLAVAAVLLTSYALMTGRQLPALFVNGETPDKRRLSPLWIYAAVIGLVGYCLPMALFPFAQQYLSSMLAGIYMAFMPLVTVFLAAIFADEPLTRRKLIGFAGGTLGVIILIGPDALQSIFSENVVAQLALLLATTAYAVATVVMRRAPDAPARSFAAAVLICGTVFALPAALMAATRLGEISGASWAAIIYLGAIPTGATAIVIIQLIRRVGAGFMAMGNYITPGVAIFFGIVLFGETFASRYAAGLAVILSGLAIAQPGPLNTLKRTIAAKFTPPAR